MGFEKISVKTLRQEVYDKLRDKIISAEILPGETISLRELAAKFGVSLMPVREALWQLESERIIVIESNKRIRVNTLTAKEMEEALMVDVTIATPNPDSVDGEAVLSILPEGKRRINVIKGGMMWPPENIDPDAKSHEVVMVNAIIVVLIDVDKVERK